MARGKDAASAARRRQLASQEATAALRVQLADERAAHHAETEALKAEIVKLKADARRKASEIAEASIEASRAEVAKEQGDHRQLQDVTYILGKQRDVFIREACRYISMTTGVGPGRALEVVWTWLTSEEMPYGFTSVPDLATWGIIPDGWVGGVLRSQVLFHTRVAKNRSRLARRGLSVVGGGPVTLDQAEEIAENPEAPEHDHFRKIIHPEYRKWRKYYRPVIDDDYAQLAALMESEL